MTRAPVTLSREMKILITALGLVALLGGWLILNNRQQADSSATPPVNTTTPVTTTTPGTTGTAGSTPGTSTGTGNTGTDTATSGTGAAQGTATGSGTLPPVTSGVSVTGDGKTEVATLPPFPVTGPNGTTPDPTLVAAVPRGINPDQPLNSLSANNPFRPFRVTPGPGATATAQPTSSVTASTPTSSSGPVTISRPSASESEINGALAGGALPVPTIPGAGNTNATSGSTGNSSGSAASTGGALPIPTIPGATAGTGGVTAVPSPTGSGVVSGNVPTASTSPAASTRPTRPPLAGVSEPTTVAVPDTFAAAGTGTGSGSGTGTGAGTAGTGSTNGGASAAAGLDPANLSAPQVISDLNAPADSSSAVSAVETAIRANGLVFNAAVLGPVNTAVFRSDKGFVVATVGQAIPNTDIILKEVTATTATLTSGTTTKTLELDKR